MEKISNRDISNLMKYAQSYLERHESNFFIFDFEQVSH